MHWLPPTNARARCTAADRGERCCDAPEHVDCAICLGDIAAYDRACGETLRSAPAVRRSDASAITARMPSVSA